MGIIMALVLILGIVTLILHLSQLVELIKDIKYFKKNNKTF